MEDQGTIRSSLEALPRTIGDAHKHLLQVIDKLEVLEGFLMGEKPSEDTPEAERETEVGVVDECFRKLAKMNSSIEKCHNRLGSIIEKLGVPERPECVDVPKRSY